jgi:hypothetical protein
VRSEQTAVNTLFLGPRASEGDAGADAAIHWIQQCDPSKARRQSPGLSHSSSSEQEVPQCVAIHCHRTERALRRPGAASPCCRRLDHSVDCHTSARTKAARPCPSPPPPPPWYILATLAGSITPLALQHAPAACGSILPLCSATNIASRSMHVGLSRGVAHATQPPSTQGVRQTISYCCSSITMKAS